MYAMNTFDFTSKLLIVILICNMSKKCYKKPLRGKNLKESMQKTKKYIKIHNQVNF